MAIEAWTLRYRLAVGELDSSFDKNRAERRLAANLSDLIHERDLVQAERDRLRAEIQRLESDRDRATDEDRSRWIGARLSLTRPGQLDGGFSSSSSAAPLANTVMLPDDSEITTASAPVFAVIAAAAT